MLKALMARGVTTVTSALFGILAARLILGEAGPGYFALYALTTTLPALLQFQDLGAGAALVNAIAKAGHPGAPEIRTTLLSVWRVTFVSATIVFVINMVMLVTGGWGHLLGSLADIPNAATAMAAALCIWTVTIPLSIWVRILLGLRQNHVTILIQGIVAPLNLGLVWLLVTTDPGLHPFLAMASFIAGLVVASIGMVVATRSLSEPVRWAARRLFQLRRTPGARVMDVGWPMLAQMISAPLSIAAQRYVLAQSAPDQAIAEYAAGAQVFFAFMGMVTAAGVTLWPRFTRERAAGRITRGPFWLSAMMFLGATALFVVVWLVREPLFAFTTNGVLEVTGPTVASFSLMVMLQAALYPLGMFLMDKRGIRFQVIPTLTMAVSAFLLAIVVTPTLGVIGPILSNCVCVLLAQIIPFSLYIIRHRERLWAGE